MSRDQAGFATRREFLKQSSLAAGAVIGGLAIARSANAAGGDTLKIGLIGCGGRGSGAAEQALRADSNVKLVAMGDAFAEKMTASLANINKALKEEASAKIDVPPERQFVGFDAYQKVIDCGVDVVIFATPTHFRPAHLKAAVAAGKHCFVEKPIAVDAPGVRSVLASGFIIQLQDGENYVSVWPKASAEKQPVMPYRGW
jgi:predicted homoserine dehydrogenase-like protein